MYSPHNAEQMPALLCYFLLVQGSHTGLHIGQFLTVQTITEQRQAGKRGATNFAP